MEAIEILRSIIADGFLSDTNTHRAHELINRIDQMNEGKDLQALLAKCREMHACGNGIEAIKLYRNKAGCGLREAHDAVTQGAKFKY